MASTTTSPHLVLKHHLAFITLYASSFAPSGGRGKNAVLPDSSFASADSGAYLMPLLLAPLIEQQQQKKSVCVCVCVFCRIGRSNKLDVGEEAGVLCVHALNHGAITAGIFN